MRCMNVYNKLGVKRVINCLSSTSRLGSSVVSPEVLEAMRDASTHFVCMDELQEKAGKVIAELTGSESAIVTTGCAAALTMATAACILKGTPLEKYRLSPDKITKESDEWLALIQRLPHDTEGLKNEVILQRVHITKYNLAHRLAGAKNIFVGTPSGCSIREIEDRINERTAAIAFVGMHGHRGAPIEDVLDISRDHDVPIIMDASYTIPPRINLRRWASMGVDLVCYSGGKSIRGPTDTGILCGSKDLVALAAVQMSPYHGIGRGFKVDKAQIVGLLTALQIYVGQDDDEEFAAKELKSKYVIEELLDIREIAKIETVVPKEGLLRGWPVVTIKLDEKRLGLTTREVVNRLGASNPRIFVYYDDPVCPKGITMNMQNILEKEEIIVVNKIKEIILKRS